MSNHETSPVILLTAIHHATAKAAELTQQHAKAYERATMALDGQHTGGIDLVELPIAPSAFEAMRKSMRLDDDTVALYDIFAISSKSKSSLRSIAGQYLAAQILWSLEAQGLLSGVPVSVKFDLPHGWEQDKDKIKSRLEKHGAFALDEKEAGTFKTIKANWDRSSS
ncbi:MAG: hypothetical protein IPJ88_10325 [Myxococcales bacterium]|nr:MAG: hypothetical protein IPJ88_10325 [Myxococcales bacterium]